MEQNRAARASWVRRLNRSLLNQIKSRSTNWICSLKNTSKHHQNVHQSTEADRHPSLPGTIHPARFLSAIACCWQTSQACSHCHHEKAPDRAYSALKSNLNYARTQDSYYRTTATQLHRVCHDTLPWLISFSLDANACCCHHVIAVRRHRCWGDVILVCL